jgi:hypothetical protein
MADNRHYAAHPDKNLHGPEGPTPENMMKKKRTERCMMELHFIWSDGSDFLDRLSGSVINVVAAKTGIKIAQISHKEDKYYLGLCGTYNPDVSFNEITDAIYAMHKALGTEFEKIKTRRLKPAATKDKQ